MAQRLAVRGVAFQEGGSWIVQGIDYDISAHADSMSELEQAFTRAILESCLITQHLGRKPLEGIKPAPHRFRELFEAAEVELKAVRRDPRQKMAAPSVKLRLFEPARAA